MHGRISQDPAPDGRGPRQRGNRCPGDIDSAVSKHISSIFAELGLYQADSGNRRVLAVLRCLGARGAG
jgi:hypothetical protein